AARGFAHLGRRLRAQQLHRASRRRRKIFTRNRPPPSRSNKGNKAFSTSTDCNSTGKDRILRHENSTLLNPANGETIQLLSRFQLSRYNLFLGSTNSRKPNDDSRPTCGTSRALATMVSLRSCAL